jgi:hypothetical protein
MRHKTQSSLHDQLVIGRYIRLVRNGRRLGGDLGTVRDWFWKGSEPWMVVQFPTGRRVAVPVCWTDLAPDAYPSKKTSPQLPAAGLLNMAEYLRGLKRRRNRKPIS